MTLRNHNPKVGEVIRIPLNQEKFCIAIVAHIDLQGDRFYLLGYAELLQGDLQTSEIQAFISTHEPSFGLSTSPALLDIGQWAVIGEISNYNGSVFFPAFKKRESDGWFVTDLTRTYKRPAAPEETHALTLTKYYSPSVLEKSLCGINDFSEYPVWADRIRVGKYPLARDYFENYAPPIAQ